MKKLYLNIIFFWLPVFLWSFLIFFLSSIPDLKIKELGWWDFVFRKIAHITEYAILVFLYFRAFKNTTQLKGISLFFWPVFLTSVYSILDEYHQSFIVGRFASLNDIIIDSVGTFTGIIITKNFYNSKLRVYGEN